MILGLGINILAPGVVDTLDRVAGCIPVQAEVRIVVQAGVCTQVLEADYTLVRAVGYGRAPVVVCILVQEVVSTPVLVVGCTPVLEGDYTAGPAEECTQGPVITHIEATYHLGPYSLTVLRNTE